MPDVKKITSEMIKEGMVSSQTEIINDHIAFRTLGVPNLGINSFEKIFSTWLQKRDFYHFRAKSSMHIGILLQQKSCHEFL